MISFKMVWCVFALALFSAPAHGAMASFDFAAVDWKAAISAHKSMAGDNLNALREVKVIAPWLAKQQTVSELSAEENRDLATINAVTSLIRPEISFAGSPVLLPFDFAAFGTAIRSPVGAAPTSAYFGRLKSLAFHPGPYGYRAYLQFKKTSTVMIAGSTIFYRLAGNPKLPTLYRCSAMIGEARKPGSADDKFVEYLTEYEKNIGMIKAEYFSETEATVPCLFAGALIEVSILCDTFGDPDCKVKDLVREVFAALSFVGGAPRPKTNPSINDPIQRLSQEVDNLFKAAAQKAQKSTPKYNEPGQLVPHSGVKGGSKGSNDSGVYGPILFPTDLSATAQTVVFRSDQHCLSKPHDKGSTCEPPSQPVITKAPIGEWRDNFCESRSSNNLLPCPEGRGHAGQDIWGEGWNNKSPTAFPLRAVVDGVAFRRFPVQPAVTVSDINGTNIDYIYRHMRPSVLTSHGIRPSRPKAITRGCRLAYVDKFQGVAEDQKTTKYKFTDGGVVYDATARHLHFEIRVPTKAGYQNVSPYKTVVEAHRAAVTQVDTSKSSTSPCN